MRETTELVHYEIRSRNLAYAMERAGRYIRNFGHERLYSVSIRRSGASVTAGDEEWVLTLTYTGAELAVEHDA